MKAVQPRVLWPYAALLGVILIFFAPLAFTNRILARGDTFLYFYPYWHLAQTAILDGRLPLWNPHIFMGVPLLANSQMGFFYPLNWPLWLLFEVPTAVKAAIIIHLTIAGWGVVALGQKTLQLSRPAAFLAALGVAGGGYLTAQIEHVNQLQGLAWLPWVLLVGHQITSPLKDRFHIGRGILLLGLLFSLQLLAGHTQTVFISGMALGLSILGRTIGTKSWGRRSVNALWPAAVGGFLALLLAAVQLWPTLELTGLSSRAGGLSRNEIVSFSWPPWLAPRALLPAVDQPLFTEYTAFLPLTIWLLAAVAVGTDWRQQRLRPVLVLAGGGFWLALGRFGILYEALAFLPGFDLFRVPARWLIVPILAISLLAGVGLDQVLASKNDFRSLAWPLLVVIGLIAAQFPVVWLSRFLPVISEVAVAAPTAATVVLQVAEVGLIALWIWRPSGGRRSILWPLALTGVSLFVSSRALPYANPTTPEAYFDRRPPALRLAVEQEGQRVPDRFLSISDIFFDPGDNQEIASIYANSLSEAALYDYTIAIKLKEIVAPNLSAVYGLEAIDGFDGGILPLASYSDLIARTILDGQTTTDGRLREYLPTVPDPSWLSLFGVRHIITDKTGDLWRDGVFFDRQLPLTLAPNETAAIAYLPEMVGTGLWVLSDRDPGQIRATFSDGQTAELMAFLVGDQVWEFPFQGEKTVRGAIVQAGASGAAVDAITLVNQNEGTFFPLVAGPFRLIHSGDVKIYAFENPLPRALLLEPEATAVLAHVIEGVEPVITRYEPERIEITAAAAEPRRLVILEANYPGWRATIDGRPTEVVTVDGFFRGVDLPAGTHKVVFEFVSRPVQRGAIISILAGLGWIVIWVWVNRHI